MATALHSRYLLTTDLRDQHADAEKQFKALEKAEELGLVVDAEIVGGSLDVQFRGPADTVARFIERCDEQDIFITQLSPSTEEERELLLRRVGNLTDVAECI